MRKKVAIVEDNPDSCELMRYMMRYMLSESYDLSEFDSGERAIEEFRQDRPDMVLMDISLPHIDGPEIVRMIRSDQDLCMVSGDCVDRSCDERRQRNTWPSDLMITSPNLSWMREPC